MAFLTPQDRSLLLESLRPPEDYQLDVAIATTYSLDLIAMMVAPVGFTLFDVDPADSDFLKRDPLEILEAIRRHAEQIVLFHQSGRIAVPPKFRPLLTYLEDRIVAVSAPKKSRSFHPKVWIIRYVNGSKDVRYRLLCLSRNLTFDRCWDTILILDGYLREDRTKGFSYNATLRDFVAALPGLAERTIPRGMQRQVSLVEKEISRVEWELDGLPFESIEFWPLGYDGVVRWPFRGRMDRLVVVSPFLSDKTLEKLTRDADRNVLVSRREWLDKTSDDALAGFDDRYQMADNVTPEAVDPESLPGSEPPLNGLHAKLYVADDGWNARTWTGSANATVSAFDGNVEFLVELIGKKSAVGVDAFLSKLAGSTSFRDLLEPYNRPEVLPRNEELEALEKELDNLRLPIAASGWVITLTQSEDTQQWTPIASTKHKLPHWNEHISVRCRLLSSGESGHSLFPNTQVNETFSPLALETLTSFVVIDIEGRTSAGSVSVRFLVNAELIGAPANRKDRLLRHMLQDRKSVLRFLLLLLSDISEDPMEGAEGTKGSWRGSSANGHESEALLEPLLRALDRSPARLAAVSSLLQELGSTDEGRQLIPEGLTELFDAVWAAKNGGGQ